MKTTKFLSVLAAPVLMFALNLPSQADATDPNAPTACKDGTTSTATGRGACSGHGGVQKTAKAAPAATTPVAVAPAPAAAPAAATVTPPTVAASKTDPAGATAKCKDGSYSQSKSHTGSCSRHGGVAQFLTAAP